MLRIRSIKELGKNVRVFAEGEPGWQLDRLEILTSADRIAAAPRERVPAVKTVLGDLEAPPFARNSVDLAVSSLAVQWLDTPEPFIAGMSDILAPGGHLVVISFHSLEDRRVKRFIRDHVRGDTDLPRGIPVRDDQLKRRLASLGKARRPSAEEVQENPRSRSAVMRVARKRY